jgi:hypothetical protein
MAVSPFEVSRKVWALLAVFISPRKTGKQFMVTRLLTSKPNVRL